MAMGCFLPVLSVALVLGVALACLVWCCLLLGCIVLLCLFLPCLLCCCLLLLSLILPCLLLLMLLGLLSCNAGVAAGL